MKNTLLKVILESEYGKEQKIGSYAQLVQKLSDLNLEDIEHFLRDLKELSFIEDEETLYNKLPMAVYYKQLPIITNSDVLVKVVMLQQADGLILVIPENVVEAQNDLAENPDLLTEKNNGISLYAEVYNMDFKDEKLHDTIKAVYIHAGNDLNPFELKDELAEEAKEEKEDTEEYTPGSFGGSALDDLDIDMSEMEEMQVNEEAYKKFRKQSNTLEKLAKNLYEKANNVFRSNVRKAFFNNTLVVEVNNKSIYQQYNTAPAVAKKLLSNFGESLKNYKGVQLVDTFPKDGKRYFVLAENVANNFWYVVKEEMDQIGEDKTYVQADPKQVVKMKKSNVRRESRKIVPYKKGRKIVFSGKIL
jgi:hypothetical protein